MWWGIPTVVAALLATATAHAAPDPEFCDRSGDGQVTAIDALIALQNAVDVCRKSLFCDSNGDYYEDTTDALFLLRYAVGMPVELSCTCIYVDECFGDQDCVDRDPPGQFCVAYFCVQCEWDTQCGSGEVCDYCSRSCIPAFE